MADLGRLTITRFLMGIGNSSGGNDLEAILPELARRVAISGLSFDSAGVINLGGAIDVVAASASPAYAIRGTDNFGGIGVSGTAGSASGGIGISAFSSSPDSPGLNAFSTAYYAGLFYNITDRGSTVLNANCIGLVAQSVYSNAFYAQQGAVSGSGSTLARNNILPAAYVTRVAASLGAFDYTAPMLTLEDVTASTGKMLDCIKQGTSKFSISNTGVTLLEDGSQNLPTLAFRQDSTTGFFRTAAGQTSYSSQGTKRFEMGANYAWIVSDTGTLFLGVSADTALIRASAGKLQLTGTTPQIQVGSATAIPAGGTAGFGFTFTSTANFGFFGGSGAPTLSAAKGSYYARSDGNSTSTRGYINTDGGTTWTAITTVA